MSKNSFFLFISILTVTILFFSGCHKKQEQDVTNKDPQINDIINAISADSVEANIRKLVTFKTRHTMSDTTSDSTGIGAARRWIFSKMKTYSRRNGGRLQVRFDGYTETENHRINKPTRVVDVVAVLPGIQLESKDRMYVVSGHYDSRVSDVMNDSSYAPGANDDASGTAAVMEMARVMSKYKFDATLVFITVAGEEQGLLGSTHYAEEAKKKNLNIAGMFDNDIIGSSTADDGTVHDDVVRVFGQGIPTKKELSPYSRALLSTGGENDTPARELARYVHDVTKEYIPDFNITMIYRLDRYLRGGDHTPFLRAGYPAIRFTEPHENFNHQHQTVRKEGGTEYADLPKFVDFNYVAKVTQVNAASLAMLANAPARPQKVGVVVSKLDNNTTLKWKANDEPDLKGYEVVWRPSIAPHWQHSVFVGDSTHYTVKGVSKDNFIFGVRSVDEKGNKSPAVYPLPTR